MISDLRISLFIQDKMEHILFPQRQVMDCGKLSESLLFALLVHSLRNIEDLIQLEKQRDGCGEQDRGQSHPDRGVVGQKETDPFAKRVAYPSCQKTDPGEVHQVSLSRYIRKKNDPVDRIEPEGEIAQHPEYC